MIVDEIEITCEDFAQETSTIAKTYEMAPRRPSLSSRETYSSAEETQRSSMNDVEKVPESPGGDMKGSRCRVSKETPKPPSGPKHSKSSTSKLPKNRISKLPAKPQESQSKGGQRSWSPIKTLSMVNKHDSIIYSVRITVKTMHKACKKWSTLRRLKDGNRGIRIAVMNGDDGGDIHVPQVKGALRAVVQIIHGNHTEKHYEDADPRLLFYMVLIHEALEAPSSVQSSEPDVKRTKKMPFFSHYAIEREISMLVAKEKYLHRVSNWLLLAVVADRIKSRVIKQLVRDELVLFCEAEQKGVPEGTRHMIKDSEWAFIQELPLVDDQMLKNRLSCIERIFKALRLLSYQVLNMDQGVLPNRNELEVYQDYKVAPCERCYSIPSDDLHEKLLEVGLWPLGSSSSYKGTLIGLIRKIKDMEWDLVRKTRRDCNQLTHLSKRLYEITRYMQT